MHFWPEVGAHGVVPNLLEILDRFNDWTLSGQDGGSKNKTFLCIH